jgi:preprotein translocase subunit SecG
MYQAIIIIHIVLGLAIIGLILMQQGKGADAGATFGGGASGSVFGAQGAASFLSRTTAILATMFFVTSLGLAWLNSHKSNGFNDLMSTTAVEKEVPDLSLPVSGGAKKDLAIPAPGNIKPPENKDSEPKIPAETDKPSVTPPAASTDSPPSTQAEQPRTIVAPAVEEKQTELKNDVPAKAPGSKKK